MDTTFIYTLSDPTTGEVRYVGKANDLRQRMYGHLRDEKNPGTHKRNWIISLKRAGKVPVMSIVDEVPKDEWHFWEKWWIQMFKSWGFDLVNQLGGGEGLTFGNQTSFRKGQQPWNKGVTGYLSDEAKESIRRARRIQPCPSWRSVIKETLDGEFVGEYSSLTEAAKSIGSMETTHISDVCRGRRSKHKGYKWRYK